MKVSIVIVNWNTRDHLIECLESIRTYPPRCSYEVIVVDNDSSDGSAQAVRQYFPEITLIENGENIGYAKANNQAIENSTGDYILLLNPDVRVKNNTIDTLVDFAIQHSDAAAVGCKLVTPDGKIQESCRSFPYPLSVFFEYTKLSWLLPWCKFISSYRMRYFRYDTDVEVDQPMASCLLISRRAWEDVGSFDESFPIFFNDVDWCYRAKQKGWKIYFTAKTYAIHYGGASTLQVKAKMIQESHRSLRKFYEKHYKHKLPAPVYWIIILAIIANSFLVSRLKFGNK
jgi:GT2 family glycosyltransferase